MSSNQTDMRKGVCRYCGQVRMVSSEPSAQQTDVDTIASKECDCTEAKIQKSRDQRYEKASQNIVNIFPDKKEITEILDMAARMIVNYKIDSVAVKCGKVTAKVSTTSKGSIKVSRIEKNENSLES